MPVRAIGRASFVCMTATRTNLLIGVAIFVIVAAVFAVNCRNAFVRFDDYDYVTKNEAISEGLTWRAVRWSFTPTGYADNYHPLTWLSLAADISLADALGLDWRQRENKVGVYARDDSALARLVHAENVVWHAANAVLLWVVMMGLGRRLGGELDSATTRGCVGYGAVAAVFALFWALHPLRVEVVAWAAERKELICVFFMLLTMIAYMRGGGSNYTFSFFTFTFSLLAKPVAVGLPAVLFAYDWAVRREGFAKSALRALPFALLAAGASALTLMSQTTALAVGRELPFRVRLAGGIKAPIVYLMQTVWPSALTINYPVPERIEWSIFLPGVALLVAMVVAGIRWRRSLFWIAWCYVCLVPMLGFVKVGPEPHSDRYTYWVGCGVACGLFAFALPLVRRYAADWRAAGAVAAAVLALLGALTVRQSLLWRDTRSLFTYVVRTSAAEPVAQMLGEELVIRAEGDAERRAAVERAEDLLRGVLDRRRTPIARSALALHLARFGLTQQALAEAQVLADMALEDGREGADYAHEALAWRERRLGNYRAAYDWHKKALKAGFVDSLGDESERMWREKVEQEEKEKKEGGENGVEQAG